MGPQHPFAHEGTLRVPAFLPFVGWATGAQCGFAVPQALFSQALVEVEGSTLLDQSVKTELKFIEAKKPQGPWGRDTK